MVSMVSFAPQPQLLLHCAQRSVLLPLGVGWSWSAAILLGRGTCRAAASSSLRQCYSVRPHLGLSGPSPPARALDDTTGLVTVLVLLVLRSRLRRRPRLRRNRSVRGATSSPLRSRVHRSLSSGPVVLPRSRVIVADQRCSPPCVVLPQRVLFSLWRRRGRRQTRTGERQRRRGRRRSGLAYM
jgi:hypothetical protein